MDFGKEFVYEFSKRTLKNILLLEREFHKEAIKVANQDYDVTLWLNSFIGLLVFPKEDNQNRSIGRKFHFPNANAILDDLNNKIRRNNSMSNHITMSLKPTKQTINNFSYTYDSDLLTARKLIRHLRNAVSHGHIEPIGGKKDGKKVVKSIIFWDYDTQKDPSPFFAIELSVDNIKTLLPAICYHLLKAKGYKDNDLSFICDFQTDMNSLLYSLN